MIDLKKYFIACGAMLLALSSLHSTWQTPQVISDPAIPQTGGTVSVPVLKVTPEGNALAIWTDAFSPTFPEEPAITTAFYAQGFGWEPPVRISSLLQNCEDDPLYTFQECPDIAINSSNYAVAVWDGVDNDCSEANGTYVVLAATRSSQGIWSDPEIISVEVPLGSFYANVSLNEDGTALAAWINQDPSGNNSVSASFLPFGGAWSAPVTFNVFSFVPGYGKPYPFINPSGDAVITWLGRSTTTNFAIQTVNFISGAFGPVNTIDISINDNISQNPRCALAPNGNAVAIWQNNGFVRASFFNGVTWEPFVILGDAVALEFHDGPEVVVDPNGNFTATWTSATKAIISASTSDGVWTAPVVVSAPPLFYRFDPFQSQETLAVNPNGDVIAIYHDVSANDPIFSAYKPFGQDWRLQELVADPSDGFVENTLNIGLADCGFAVSLWQNEEDTLVYASINQNLLQAIDPLEVQCCQKRGSGRVCLNILSWASDPCVLFYNIQCNGILVATVVNTGADTLQFRDPVACHDCVYTITTVNTFGFEGDPVPFTVL